MRFQWLDPGNNALRRGLEYGRLLVEEHQPYFVVVDFLGMPPISVSDELWMSAFWFPRVIRQSLQRVAVVTGPQHMHNQLVTETMFWLARHLMRFQVQFFDDVTTSLHWLLESNPDQVAPLLAEWPADSPPAPPPPKY